MAKNQIHDVSTWHVNGHVQSEKTKDLDTKQTAPDSGHRRVNGEDSPEKPITKEKKAIHKE